MNGSPSQASSQSAVDVGRKRSVLVTIDGLFCRRRGKLRRCDRSERREADATRGRVLAPLHGILIELRVAEGDRVRSGDKLAVIEAMKMQHEIKAPVSGTVASVLHAAGKQDADKSLLFEITPDEGM